VSRLKWVPQLFVYIREAELSPEKQAILNSANDVVRRLGIEFQTFQKPVKLRKRPLEDPLVYCEPPDEDSVHKPPHGVD